MIRNWFRSPLPRRLAGAPSLRVEWLEDRATPAMFTVGPGGDFATLAAAITATNAAAGADTLVLQSGTFTVGTQIVVTDTLTVQGQGRGSTTVLAGTDIGIDYGNTFGLFNVRNNAAFNVNNLTLDGNGSTFDVSELIAYDYVNGSSTPPAAGGTIDNVAFQNVVYAGATSPALFGTGVIVAAGSVTVSNTSFANMQRGGVWFFEIDPVFNSGVFTTTTGTVRNVTYTGRGAVTPTVTEVGVEVSDGAAVTISGNTFQNVGSATNTLSAAVLVHDTNVGLGNANPTLANLVLIGNDIKNGAVGLQIGLLNTNDRAAVLVQYNNVFGNATAGILSGDNDGATPAPTPIDAIYNFWGSAAGPGASGNNGVVYAFAANNINTTPFLTAVTPVVFGATVPQYLAAIAPPTVVITDSAGGSPVAVGATVTFTLQFDKAVTGVELGDLSNAGTATGAFSNLVAVDADTYTVQFTATGAGTLRVQIGSTGVPIQDTQPTPIALVTPALDDTTITVTASVIVPPADPLPPAPATPPSTVVATSGGVVQIRNADGTTTTITPYVGFAGGTNIVTADLNGDGVLDVVTGTATGSSHVKVFDGATGAEIRSFLAFDGLAGGVSVATADLNRDGVPDLVVGAGRGASGGHLKVFDGATGGLLRSFLTFDGFAGGIDVAAGDLNRDGVADLVVTAKGMSHVKAFDGATGGLLRSFFFGLPGIGASVAAGDVNGDGSADLIVGSTRAGSQVTVFDGATDVVLRTFTAFPGFEGGVRVASRDVNGDGVADVLVGTMAVTAHVKAFSGADLSLLQSFIVSDSSGVFVG